MISKEEILKRGYVDVKVRVSGLRQSHRLEIVREKTSAGVVPFLVSKYYIPTMELVRLAEELQLPVKHNNTIVYPKGTMAGHFAEKSEKKSIMASIRAETVEAEVEDEAG